MATIAGAFVSRNARCDGFSSTKQLLGVRANIETSLPGIKFNVQGSDKLLVVPRSES